jgi:hypothetical protein
MREDQELAVSSSCPATAPGCRPGQRTVHRSHRSIPPRPAFAGFRFPADVIVLAVRWYLHFGLSYRDLEELLAERGVEVDHVSIYRWVLRFTPLLADAARPFRAGDRCARLCAETPRPPAGSLSRPSPG